jgi:hypothetical protein
VVTTARPQRLDGGGGVDARPAERLPDLGLEVRPEELDALGEASGLLRGGRRALRARRATRGRSSTRMSESRPRASKALRSGMSPALEPNTAASSPVTRACAAAACSAGRSPRRAASMGCRASPGATACRSRAAGMRFAAGWARADRPGRRSSHRGGRPRRRRRTRAELEPRCAEDQHPRARKHLIGPLSRQRGQSV